MRRRTTRRGVVVADAHRVVVADAHRVVVADARGVVVADARGVHGCPHPKVSHRVDSGHVIRTARKLADTAGSCGASQQAGGSSNRLELRL